MTVFHLDSCEIHKTRLFLAWLTSVVNNQSINDKMKYTINLTVVFDPEQRTLALNNNNQTAIELSKPSCRVLSEFIKNNKVNLSRDALLKNAWEDYGFPPSNASLNNCISELRKSFVSLGIEKPVIITLPRVGFRMEADIHPTPKDKTEISVEKTVAAESDILLPIEEEPATMPVKPTKKIKKSMLWSILTVAAGLGIVGMVLLLWSPSAQLTLIGTYQQCDIYSIRKTPLPGSDLRVKKMLESENLDCNQVKQDIFYTEERPDNDLMKITFLATCQKNQADSDYQHCKTFKVVE